MMNTESKQAVPSSTNFIRFELTLLQRLNLIKNLANYDTDKSVSISVYTSGSGWDIGGPAGVVAVDNFYTTQGRLQESCTMHEDEVEIHFNEGLIA